jgi:ATP-dependent Lon protease
MVTTLTWTPSGGELLVVESTRMPGRGEVHLTGRMGDVMKESAAAAFTFVRARAQRFGLADDFLNTIDVHVHLPNGGLPKDGPALGLPILVSLVSLFKNVTVRPDVALTGEITLRGKLLRVDGIKQKCLAAHHAGIKHVIMPRQNEPDLWEIPARIRDEIQLHLVSNVDEALAIALTEPRAGRAPSPAAAAPA